MEVSKLKYSVQIALQTGIRNEIVNENLTHSQEDVAITLNQETILKQLNTIIQK